MSDSGCSGAAASNVLQLPNDLRMDDMDSDAVSASGAAVEDGRRLVTLSLGAFDTRSDGGFDGRSLTSGNTEVHPAHSYLAEKTRLSIIRQRKAKRVPRQQPARKDTPRAPSLSPNSLSTRRAADECWLDNFRREKRASSLDRGHLSRAREGEGRVRVSSGQNYLYDRGYGGRTSFNSSPIKSLDLSLSAARNGMVRDNESGGGGRGRGFHGNTAAFRSSLDGGMGGRGGRGQGRGHSLPAMKGAGRNGEADNAYKAQLAQLLSRWDAERATTADLHGRAAAVAGLHDRLRTSATELSRTRGELESARSELEVERRARSSAERELGEVRIELTEQRRAAEACAAEKQSLRSRIEELQLLAARVDDTVTETALKQANLEATEQLRHTQERLQKLEELRSRETESLKVALDTGRKGLEEAEAENAERSREQSARAAGLQELLREQGALLADREERLAEERAGRAAERLELRELRSGEAGRLRELKEKSDEIEELNELLVQLQEGDTVVADAMGDSRALQAENEMLQTRLDQALGESSALEERVRATEGSAGMGGTGMATELIDTKEKLRTVEAERSHLEQRLNAIEARVSESVRNRADLSRRLAETAVAAEEAGVQNQRLRFRVRSLSETWAGDQPSQSIMELSTSSSSEWKSNTDQADEAVPRGVSDRKPLVTEDAFTTMSDFHVAVEALQSQLTVAEARAAAAEAQAAANGRQTGADGEPTSVASASPFPFDPPPPPSAEAGAPVVNVLSIPQQHEPSVADVVVNLRGRLEAAMSELSAARANERSLHEQLATARTTLPDEESEVPCRLDQRLLAEPGKGGSSATNASDSAQGHHEGVRWAVGQSRAAEGDPTELMEALAAVRSQLSASQAELSEAKQQWSSALADAQGRLAYEAERTAALEREVTALRSRQQQIIPTAGGSAANQPWISDTTVPGGRFSAPSADQLQSKLQGTEEILSNLKCRLEKQAEALTVAQGRAQAAEGDLAAARTEIESLKPSPQNGQGGLDAAKRGIREHAGAITGPPESEQTHERETALRQRLQDAEVRAATVGKELEVALRTSQARSQVSREDDFAEASRRQEREENAAKALKDVERRLDISHEELAAARAKAAQASQRSALSAAEATTSRAEAAELRARVSAGEKQLAKAFSKMEGLRADERALEYRLRELEARASEDASRLQEVSEDNGALRSSVSQLKDQLGAAEAECAAARERESQAVEAQQAHGAKVEELIAAWTQARDGVAEATRRASQADKELVKVKREADTTMVATRAAAAEDVASAKLRADQATKTAAEAEEQAKAARAEAGDIAAKLSAARVKGEAAEADLAAVRAWAEAGSQRAGASLSALQRQVTEVTERADTAESTLATVRADLAVQTEAFKVSREKTERVAAAHAASHAESAEVTSELKSQLLAAETRADSSTKEAACARRELEINAVMALNEVQNQVDEANAGAAAAQHELSELQQALRAAEEAASSAAAKAVDDATRSGAELAAVKEELAQARIDLSTYRVSVAAQSIAQSDALERAEVAARDAEKIARLAAASTVQRLERALAEAKASVVEARETAQMTQDDLRSAVEAVKTELKLKSEALTAREREIRSADVALNAERAETSWLNAELSETRDQLDAIAARMIAGGKTAAEGLSKVQKQLDEAVSRERTARRQLDDVQDILRKEQTKTAAAARATSEVSRLRSEIAELEHDLAQAKAALSAHRDAALTQGAAQAEAVERVEEAARHAESAARAAAAAEVHRLRAALSEAEASNSTANATEEGLRALLDATRKDLAVQSEALAAAEGQITAQKQAQAEAAVAAEEESAKLQATVNEAQMRQRKTAEELAHYQEVVQGLQEIDSESAVRSASEKSRLEAELADARNQLAQAKIALSSSHDDAAAKSSSYSETLKRIEEAARNSEESTRAAVAHEMERLERELREANANGIKANETARATEENLQSLLTATEADLRIRSEALTLAEEAQRSAEMACLAARAETTRLSSELSEIAIQCTATEEALDADAKAVAREHERAAIAAAKESRALQGLLNEAQCRERKLKDDLAETQQASRISAASGAAKFESELAAVIIQLQEANTALSAQRANAAVQGLVQTEAFERVEQAACQAEATAQAAAAAEVQRLEISLSEALDAKAAAKTAADATEEGLRAVLEATERDLFVRCEAYTAAEEGRIAMELARDEAHAEVERVTAELNCRFDALQRQAQTSAKEAAERYARADALATADIAQLRKRLDEAETRESVFQTELALSKDALQAAADKTTRLESIMSQLKIDLEQAQAIVSAQRSNAAALGSAQSKALLRVEEVARQAGESARASAAVEIRRLEAAVVAAEGLAQETMQTAAISKTELNSRLVAADAAAAVSLTRSEHLASEIAHMSAETDHLRTQLASAEASSRKITVRSDTEKIATRQTKEDLHRAMQEEKSSNTSYRKETELLILNLQNDNRQLKEQRVAAEQARAAVEEESRRLGATLREEVLALDKRAAELATERDDATAQLATARHDGRGATERQENESEVSRADEVGSCETSEMRGSATSAANAARVEAERDRDEANSALLSALESSFVFEDELTAQREGGARFSMKVEGLTAGIREAVEAGVEAAAEAGDERRALLSSIDMQMRAAREEGEVAGWAAAEEATLAVARTREAELSQRLTDALVSRQDPNDSSESQSRMIEARQWEEAEASFAHDMEASRRREADASGVREDAEVAQDRAEQSLDQALVELQTRDVEREEIDRRLREAEQELSTARGLLREAGAERELLRSRLEEARRGIEELIHSQVAELRGTSQGQKGQHLQVEGRVPASDGREAFLRERELREEAESRYAQMRAALDEQLERDAEALERMDELTLQAREEQAATELERARLEGCVGQLERGKRAAESTLHATQQELEEACLELEDFTHRLEQSQLQLSTARNDLSEARESLAVAQGELAEARSALSVAEHELLAVKEELSTAREALATARGELGLAKDDLEIARSDLRSASRKLLSSSQSADGELAGIRRQLTTAEGELSAVREELSATKHKLAVASVDASSVRTELDTLMYRQNNANDEGGRDTVLAGSSKIAGDSLESQLRIANGQKQALQEALARVEAQLASTDTERASVKYQLVLVEESLEAKEASRAREECARADGDRMLASVRAELLDESARSGEALRVAEENKQETEASLAQLQEKLGVAEADAGALREQLELSIERRTAAEAEASDLGEKLAQAQAEIAVIALEAERAEESKDDANEQRGARSRLERELKAAVELQVSLEENVSSSKADLLAAGRLAQERVEKAEALEGQNTLLRQELGVLESSVAASKAEASRLEAELADAESSSAQSEERLQEARRSAEASAAELEIARQEIRESKAKLAATATEIIDVRAECSAVSQSRDLLQTKLEEMHGQGKEVLQRDAHEETERRRVDLLVQESRAALEASLAAAAASASAEKEAAERAQHAREARETAEDCLAAAESRAEKLESDCDELREAAGRLGVQVQEACEREGVLRGLLERAEEGRVEAEREGVGARKEIVGLRSELPHAKRRLDETESERRQLTGQVTAITAEIAASKERERHAREELSVLRVKVSAAEDKVLSRSSEAERQERLLRAEMQARDARISELEAQTVTLTAARDRLSRARDAVVADAYRSQDLLRGASDRLRRSRRPSRDRRRPRRARSVADGKSNSFGDEFGKQAGVGESGQSGAELAGVVFDNSVADSGDDDSGRAQDVRASSSIFPDDNRGSDNDVLSSAGLLPSRRPVFLDSSMDYNADRAPATGRRRFATDYPRDSVNLRASMPNWGGSVEGAGGTHEVGSPASRAFLTEGMGEREDHEGEGTASAALDLLREVERMQAAVWELEQNERILLARLDDEADAFLSSEETRRGAEERARATAAEMDRLHLKAENLEEDNKKMDKLLTIAQASSLELEKRLARSEPLVEDLKAKIRASKEEVRRLRGQLEATGLSDTAMMGLLKSKDAALAAAAARASASETAKRELQEQVDAAEAAKVEAEEIAESMRGQLEGSGTFDRRTKGMLNRAEEELEHLRVQAAEADTAATTLRARLDEATAEAETLAAEFHESEEAVASRDELLKEAREAADVLKQRLDRVVNEAETSARRAGEAETLAAAESATVVHLREDLEASTSRLNAVLKEVDEGKALVLEKSRSEEALRAEGEELRVHVEELEGALSEKSEQFDSLEAAKETQERTLAEMEGSIGASRSEADELRGQIASGEVAHAEAHDAATEAAAQATEQIERGLTEIGMLKARLEQNAADLVRAREEGNARLAQVHELGAEVDAKKLEAEELQHKLTKMGNRAETLDGDVTNLHRRVETLEGENATQQNQLATLETRAGQERSIADNRQAALDLAREEAFTARESLAEMKSELVSIKQALDHARTRCDAESADVAAIREDLTTTRERLRRSQDEDLATALSELEASRSEVAALTSERDTLMSRLEEEGEARRAAEDGATAARREAADARNAASGLREAGKAQKAQAAADIQEAVGVAEAAAAETRVAVRDLDETQSELDDVRAQLEQESAARQEAQAAGDIARAGAVELNEKLLTRQAELKIYKEHEHLCSRGEKRLQDLLSISNEKTTSMHYKVVERDFALEERRQALEDAERARDDANAAATAAAESAARREASLVEELDGLKSTVDDTRRKLEAEVASLTEQLEDAIEESEQASRDAKNAVEAAEKAVSDRARESAAMEDSLKQAVSAVEERAHVTEAAVKTAETRADEQLASAAEVLRSAEAAAQAAADRATAALEQAHAEHVRSQALEKDLEAAREEMATLAENATAGVEAEDRKGEEEQAAEADRMRLLGRELDSLLRRLRSSGGETEGEEIDRNLDGTGDVETSEGERQSTGGAANAGGDGGETQRLLSVVREAAAHLNGLHEALAVAGQEADAASRELEGTVAEINRLRSHIVALEETLAELQSVRSAFAESDQRREELEGELAELSRQAEAASLIAASTVESLEKALKDATDEARRLRQERGEYGAEMEEALAEGQESILSLEEALEHTLNSARQVLDRAEAAASEAEGGEVENLQAELRSLERSSPTLRSRNRTRISEILGGGRPHHRSASPPLSPENSRRNQGGVFGRGWSRFVPSQAAAGMYEHGVSYNPRASWPPPGTSGTLRRLDQSSWVSRRRRSNSIPGRGDDEVDLGGLVGAEPTVRQAASEMEEVCFGMETLVLRQAIDRAADVRRSLNEAGLQQEAAVERSARDQLGSWTESDREAIEDRLAQSEAERNRAQREADEHLAELDALKAQRESLVRRVAAAEAETALSHAIGTVSGQHNTMSSLPTGAGFMRPLNMNESQATAIANTTAVATSAAAEAAEAALAAARTELTSARNELSAAREELDILRNCVSREEAEHQRFETEKVGLENAREKYAQMRRSLEADRRIVGEERDGLDEVRTRLDRAKRDLEETCSKFEKERSAFEQERRIWRDGESRRASSVAEAAIDEARAEATAQASAEIDALKEDAAAAEERASQQALTAEQASAALQARFAEVTEKFTTLKEELAVKRRAVEDAERRGERLEERAERAEARRRGVEEELEAAGRRARKREENIRDLESQLQAESRRKQFLEHALQDAEATRRFKISGVSSIGDGAEASKTTSTTVIGLRGEVSRARARAELLEERLDETVKCNRRLEREVAQAVELGARAEAELSAALAGERIQRNGELTEIKSVVDEMMTLDASASGGGIAGSGGDVFSPPRERRVGQNRRYLYPGTSDIPHNVTMNLSEAGATTSRTTGTLSAGAAARLTEAWSLLEASEAARRQLQGEVKAWAERATKLEGALAAAEAAVEEGAREARLLAASLQDARQGLAAEERARREAEGRADALRAMLQAGDGGGSGGGVSPAGGGGGGDVARSLAGQVKALRSRVEELLERARDAEVREVLEKRGRKAAQRALSELASREGLRPGTAPTLSSSTEVNHRKRQSTRKNSSNALPLSAATRRMTNCSSFSSDALHSAVLLDDSSRVSREEEEGGDAVWLRDAEALLARSSHDLGY